MEQYLSKAKFKEKYKYSETTYHRRMKEFKDSRFGEGYNAVTHKEVMINIDLYEQFRVWKAQNKFRVKATY